MKWVDLGSGAMEAFGKKGRYYLSENNTERDLVMLEAPEGDDYFQTIWEAMETAEEWDA